MSEAVTPEELWSRVMVARGADVRLARDQLESWLLSERLAVQTPGGLAPTSRAVELGGGLIDVTRGRRR